MIHAVRSAAQAMFDDLRAWRRHIHQNPELSGQEEQTAAFIADELRRIGLTPQTQVGGEHGLYADIGPDAGPAVALRADFDALPIQEETRLEFASKNPGVMHACGHDAHVAMLLGAARLLVERAEQLPQRVRLIFQPHEELFPGGAPRMIDGGVLDSVGHIFALHVWSPLQVGQLGIRSGPFMAAVNPIRAVVRGRGGHAAMPDGAVDPIVASAQIITALQTVVSRNVPIDQPAVVSVTQINAGTADNVIPEQAFLTGTIRTFDESVRELVIRRVKDVIHNTAVAHGAQAEIEVQPGYPVLVNDVGLTERVLNIADALGIAKQQQIAMAPMGGGEDFAYYCQRVPGAIAFLGVGNNAKQCTYPHHHPRFDLDEDALPTGAALLAAFALRGPL